MNDLQPIQLPEETSIELQSALEIITPHPYGVVASIFLQEEAKKISSYNTPVECGLVGQAKDGQPIAVNSLGRWLFGVPGVGPHLRAAAQGNTVTVFYPAEVHPMIDDFMNELKQSIESQSQ